MFEREIIGEGTAKQIAVIQSNTISFVNPFTGVISNTLEIGASKAEKEFLLISLKRTQTQVILAVT